MVAVKAKGIIKKWYKALNFPECYDVAFCNALEKYDIDETVTIECYNEEGKDDEERFLYYLYFCEEAEKRYAEKGIDKAILFDTLGDMRRWLDTFYKLRGKLSFGVFGWIKEILRLKIFKLGRLEFCFDEYFTIPEKDVKEGDTVIAIHIPADGPLDAEECKKSIAMARTFFPKYYPEREFKVIACRSWLLNKRLEEILDENSNIVKFMNLFTVTELIESDSLFKFVFRWDITREELSDFEPTSSFAKKIKELALEGHTFYNGLGYLLPSLETNESMYFEFIGLAITNETLKLKDAIVCFDQGISEMAITATLPSLLSTTHTM